VVGLFVAELYDKEVYALKIIAPELLYIRCKYGLSEKLRLRDYHVELHTTIAISIP
jgi:hypothetical protein